MYFSSLTCPVSGSISTSAICVPAGKEKFAGSKNDVSLSPGSSPSGKGDLKSLSLEPGKYKAKFNISLNTYSQEFEILPDPRLSDISGDDYNEQEELLLEIRDFMTEVRKFESMVESKIEKKKKNRDLNLVSKELNTQEGTYMRPMLIDQIRYLQAMLSRADQRPGNDAYIRFNDLKSQFKDLKDKL